MTAPIVILFFLAVAGHGLENAIRIKKRLKRKDYRDLNHRHEAVKYVAASLVIGLYAHLRFDWLIIHAIAIAFLTRALFFDVLLNAFRGLRLDYENYDDDGERSFFDMLERWAPFWHRMLVYTFFYVVVIFEIIRYQNSLYG